MAKHNQCNGQKRQKKIPHKAKKFINLHNTFLLHLKHFSLELISKESHYITIHILWFKASTFQLFVSLQMSIDLLFVCINQSNSARFAWRAHQRKGRRRPAGRPQTSARHDLSWTFMIFTSKFKTEWWCR